jgi:hypothetical protein
MHDIYIKNKLNQNPLGSFKDLSLHRDRQREATLFYTMLLLATHPDFTWVPCCYRSVSLLYYVCYLHINLPLQSLYPLKSVGQFERSKHTWGKTLFHTIL